MHSISDLDHLLLAAYIKVLHINLTDDTYEEVRIEGAAPDPSRGNETTISGWLRRFAELGNVSTDDLERFRLFTDLDTLRNEFAKGSTTASLLYRRRSANGTYRWARMTIARSRDYTNEGQRCILSVVDVNDTIEMAQEVTTQRLITQSLVDMYFSCLYVDMNTRTYQRIHVADALAPYVPETGTLRDYVETYTTRLVVPHDIDTLYEQFSVEAVRSHLLTRDAYDYEYQATTSWGEIWCRIAAIPVDRNPDGSSHHVIIAMQDITEQAANTERQNNMLRDAVASAEAANAAKSDFMSRMSHDIRTPLNGIIGMTAVAGAHLDDRERVADSLTKIAAAGKHLLALVNDILDLSKIESGKVDLTEAEFNLPSMLDELLSMIRTQVESHHQDLRVNVHDIQHENVIGDNLRLQQVFLNIMSNAVKYTQDGGRISISLTELPTPSANISQFRFVCEDNGYGMSQEFLERIFEPFERATDERVDATQGTGLGMPIARNIVNMMGGDIHVESKENVGSRFTVEFKIKVVNEEELRSEDLIDLPVLVVDDDEVTCESACIALNELGMKGSYCLGGAEAVELVQTAHESGSDYYACLIDWKMPDIDGFETTRRIRRIVGPDVTIIIISSYEWDNIEEEARAAGADAFITKPLFRSRIYAAFRGLSQAHTESKADAALGAFTEKNYSGRRFLLVEDNDLNREIATEILQSTGADVESAVNGLEGLDMFQAAAPGHYDMIFMDIRMPVMDGYEATRAIRASVHPDAQTVPIIAMTADAFVEDVAHARAAGMNRHMAKPIDLGELLSIMEECLENN